MSLMSAWPTVTDDTGLGQDGTPLDSALFTPIKASIEDQVSSATNADKPKAITDEVITARGNKAALNTRIAGVIDANGLLVAPASLMTTAQLQEVIGGKNLAPDAAAEVWADSLTLMNTAMNVTTMANHAISGTGQTKTKRKWGEYCLYGDAGASAAVWIDIIHNGSTEDNTLSQVMIGQTFSAGCWVWTGTANNARLLLYDGAATAVSSFHTGDSTWQWLTLTFTVTSAFITFWLQLRADTGDGAWFSGWTVVLGDQPPTKTIPNDVQYQTLTYSAAAPATGDGLFYHIFKRPVVITDVQAYVGTAPTTGGVDIDVEKWNGSGWVSVFGAAKVDFIASGDQLGNEVPDATAGGYLWRCFEGSNIGSGTAEPAQAMIRLNLDAVEDALDLTVQIRYKELVDSWGMLRDNAFMGDP